MYKILAEGDSKVTPDSVPVTFDRFSFTYRSALKQEWLHLLMHNANYEGEDPHDFVSHKKANFIFEMESTKKRYHFATIPNDNLGNARVFQEARNRHLNTHLTIDVTENLNAVNFEFVVEDAAVVEAVNEGE